MLTAMREAGPLFGCLGVSLGSADSMCCRLSEFPSRWAKAQPEILSTRCIHMKHKYGVSVRTLIGWLFSMHEGFVSAAALWRSIESETTSA